jgi:membrane protease YdiL (CAAX protease family)
MFAIMLAGPTAASLALTSMFAGAAGLRALMNRMKCWRAPRVWLAVVLVNPVVLLVVLLTLATALGPNYRPGFSAVGFLVGLVGSFFEEIGWTGFATPRLMRRFSPVATGLVLGVILALWHALPDYMGNIGQMNFPQWVLRSIGSCRLSRTAC